MSTKGDCKIYLHTDFPAERSLEFVKQLALYTSGYRHKAMRWWHIS